MHEHSRVPHGWHTLDIECNGVLSLGLYFVFISNRVGEGLTRSTIRPLLPFVCPVTGAGKTRPRGREHPVAWTGQHPWLRLGWKILPTRIGYFSNTSGDHRFRCDDNNVTFTQVQPGALLDHLS